MRMPGATPSQPSQPEIRVALVDRVTPAEREAVITGLVAFNEERTGPSGARQLGVLVRDGTGAVCGGLVGRTTYDWLVVELLFLPASLRGAGLGRRLLRDAEAEAVRRGCRFARLDTASFQARGFYEKEGYEVFATLDLARDGHALHFMRKALTPGAET